MRPLHHSPPAESQDAVLEQTLARFEKAWCKGTPPSLDEYYKPGADPGSRQLLEELIKIDLYYRWLRRQAGAGHVDCLRLEDYVSRYPALGRIEQLSLDLIGTEYWVRHCHGDRPGKQEYVGRFGRHGAALLEELNQVDLEVAADQKPSPAGQVPERVPPAPPSRSAATMIDVLRTLPLLTASQLDEVVGSLQARFSEPRALAKELIGRGWMTPYQVNMLLQGRAQELAVGPYLVLERLGSGGGGHVFKVRHQLMQRIAALKVIRKDLVADPEVVSRFQREILSISQLTHPNVVQAYDAGTIGAGYYLAMEYVVGTDLAELVQQRGPLPPDLVCTYARQAALGLQHIHERGLVHRDIKPSNLLATSSPGSTAPDLVKILDLGLARLDRSVGGVAAGTITDAGTVMMGTLDFMAPEQALNTHTVDIRADIYSLGCTLYFLLTGKAPYSGGTLAQILMAHQQSPVPDVGQTRRDLPPGLAGVLQKMMAKRPEARYQTPGEVAQVFPPAARALVPVVAGRAPIAVCPVVSLPRAEVIVIDSRPNPGGGISIWRRALGVPVRAGRQVMSWKRRTRLILAGLAAFLLLGVVGWVALSPSGPKQAYLSDLQEEVKPQRGVKFSKGGKYLDWPDGTERRITIGGEPANKGIFMQAPSMIGYSLKGQYRRFKTGVALADGSKSIVPITFRVVCDDGKRTWESKPISSVGTRYECSLDISDVDKLELFVHSPVGTSDAFPFWVNPQVSR